MLDGESKCVYSVLLSTRSLLKKSNQNHIILLNNVQNQKINYLLHNTQYYLFNALNYFLCQYFIFINLRYLCGHTFIKSSNKDF